MMKILDEHELLIIFFAFCISQFRKLIFKKYKKIFLEIVKIMVS